jgi:hypothetical protein
MPKTKLIPVGDVLLENEKLELYPVMLENKFGERDAFVSLLRTKGQQVGKDTEVYLMTPYCGEDFFDDAFRTTPICENSECGGIYKLRYVVHPYYGVIQMDEIKKCPRYCTPENCHFSVANVLNLIQRIAEKDPHVPEHHKVAPRLLVFYAEKYVCNYTEKYVDPIDPTQNDEKAMEIENSWMLWDCSQTQKVEEAAKIRDINVALVMDCKKFIEKIKNHPLPLSKESSTPAKVVRKELFIDPAIEGKLIKFLERLEIGEIDGILRRAIEEPINAKTLKLRLKAKFDEKQKPIFNVSIEEKKKCILEFDLLLHDELISDTIAAIIGKK